MLTGKVWIYWLLFVCLFVQLRISPESPAKIKLAASNFAWRFMGVLGRECPILGTLLPRSPKSDESTTNPEVNFRVGRSHVIACLSISRGVWT